MAEPEEMLADAPRLSWRQRLTHGEARLLWVVAAALGLWLAVALPAALGRATFYYRDHAEVFVPLKAFGAAELRAGRVPATNPTWGLGQPFRGDPNADAFYPGNLLYLLLPFWSAFNLHLCLHWLLAGIGMGLLARALAQSRAAAILAAITFAGSGWLLSMVASIYSVTVIAAWLPFVLLGGVRGGRRGVALGGLALGMALLDAEPVLVLGLTLLPLLALQAHGWRRGAVVTALIGVGGALVGLPQLVATARIAPWTFRFGHGLLRSQVTTYLFHPARLLELLLPLPFGLPGHPGARGVWAAGVLPRVPLYLSIYCGTVALLLAIAGARRRRALAALAAAGMVLACAGRWTAGPLQALFAGAFRSPEKLVFLTALALPLLAGEGLDRILAGEWKPTARLGVVLASVGAVAALTAWVLGAPVAAPPAARRELLLQLVVAALLLLVAAWAARRGSAAWLLALQLLAILQLRPLLLRESPEALRAPASFPPGHAVLPVEVTYPPWEPSRPPPPVTASPAWLAEAEAFELGPTPGVLQGRSYPAAGDFTGMSYRFFTLTLFRLAHAPWNERIAWARLLGAEVITARRPLAAPGARLLAVRSRDAEPPAYFYAVASPAPAAWWPRRVVVAPSPRDAFDLYGAPADPTALAVVPLPLEHHPGARVRLVSASTDRLEVEVAGEGGLLVVRRAFQNFWRAQSGERELPVLPADLALLGVLVPPGEHRVALSVSSWPEALAAAIAAAAASALLVLFLFRRR